MKKEARLWKNLSNKSVQCNLCAHRCKISDNKTGICGVRKAEDGKLFTLIYGSCSSIAADPIEKKPLYHFKPGTNAFSIGTIGCNFKCLHCQNHSISTADVDFPYIKEISAEDSVNLAKQNNCQGIAYTYNEPTIWHEFTCDSARVAKESDLYTVYVTNGYMAEESLNDIAPFLDAMNIDVKAFNEGFYKKICKAKLQPVLDTCIHAKKLGIHIELTYLVIPGLNDSLIDIKNFLMWILEKLGTNIPVHFSCFHPDFNMRDVPRTPMKTMQSIYQMAKDMGILYPYLGNVAHGDYDNTYCPKCGNICVERKGYTIENYTSTNGKCISCGFQIFKV